MRILLIGNFVLDRQESMLRFAALLAAGLRSAGHDVVTWSPEPRAVRLLKNYRYSGAAKFVGYFDKFVLFPRRVRHQLAHEHSADVVHIVDHGNAVYAPLFTGMPLLATCHDLLQIRSARGEFPQHRLTSLGRRYQQWILHHIARLPLVVVPSRKTADDLRRLTGLPPARVNVIPHGLNFPYRRSAPSAARASVGRLLRERHLPVDLLSRDDRGFLLNVGGGQWYKNRRGLLDLYAELRRLMPSPPRLLMVGKPLSPDRAAQCRQLGLGDDFWQLAHVSELQLQALYSLADALVFPSWEEGFGWPVAEAHACGCPVFTSDRAPMTEVGGDAAAYIDPADPAGAARRIAELWPRRSELAVRGLVRAREWSQDLMVDRYIATYEALRAARSGALAA
jgi:glycosyltransferase involved in cell wall biosynthesis